MAGWKNITRCGPGGKRLHSSRRIIATDSTVARARALNSTLVNATPIHPFTRLTGLFVALVTVWCLGCSGFEPRLGFLTDNSAAGMNCGSEQSRGSVPLKGAASATEHRGPNETQIVASLDQNEQATSCGCRSCYSVLPLAHSLALEPVPTSKAIPGTEPFLESVKREPLVPPPQRFS